MITQLSLEKGVALSWWLVPLQLANVAMYKWTLMRSAAE
jgi:hypothetical protein